MAYLQANQIGFRDTSVSATVPDNDVARLMYYLNCVCQTIEYNDNDISRLRDYENYWSLSNDEIRMLLALCLTLSPDVFNNKIFFQSDAMCGDSGNKFYEISQVRHQLLAVESIVVAGRTRQVNSIMTYKMSWMRRNYFGPIQSVAQKFSSQNRRPTTAKSSSCVIS